MNESQFRSRGPDECCYVIDPDERLVNQREHFIDGSHRHFAGDTRVKVILSRVFAHASLT